MPSPLGEGQTDTPINHCNRGEVPHDASVRSGKCWYTLKERLDQGPACFAASVCDENHEFRNRPFTTEIP